jgi:tyrosyl-tRNA synthetase
MKIDQVKIEELLTRGVDEVIDLKNLEEKIKSGKELRVKLGIDPTSPNIHLGRSIPLLKLKDFQDLGHKVVFIIGDFTGLIGDTSDKESERPMLTKEDVKKNLETYIDQAGKIIDIDKTEIHYNSKWLKELNYMDIGKQADAFSLNEFISRTNIAKRLESGKRVSLRELLYPLMQGYDSKEVEADVELGGTDQRFNILTGRDIQRLYGQEPQDVITNPLIEGTDGRKMSSSFGNTINLMDTPNDMFGKIMSVNDDLMIKYFILFTRVDMTTINKYEEELKTDINPRDIKIKLGNEVVRMYHGEEEADKSVEYFVNTFTKHKTPDDVAEFKAGEYDIISILVDSELCSSKSDARRTIEGGGVKVNEVVVEDVNQIVESGSIIQKGKINFIKIS